MKRFRPGVPVKVAFADLSRSGAAAVGFGLRMERKTEGREPPRGRFAEWPPRSGVSSAPCCFRVSG
ncbi:hypothetical protein LG35_06650 [Alistipes inops]|uniref:PilZ domain-containing protein n=1 Tax=Alistipes inops TaxID=1501391 RepID=A0ABR4YI26_9BACT|nr:hypothetical protein LG35_06650 [Alistipes inops]